MSSPNFFSFAYVKNRFRRFGSLFCIFEYLFRYLLSIFLFLALVYTTSKILSLSLQRKSSHGVVFFFHLSSSSLFSLSFLPILICARFIKINAHIEDLETYK
jgi:hypothetical protein